MERLTERLENGVINVKYASQHETAIHRLVTIEDILCDDTDEYDLDRLAVMCNQRMSMRDEVSQRFSLTAKIPLDRLRELAEADREGRCVVLPIDVGDTVYHITTCKDFPKVLDGTLYDDNGAVGTATGYYCPCELAENCPFDAEDFDCDENKNKLNIFEDTVEGIHIDEYDEYFQLNYSGAISFEDVGRTVFLTRAEAEAVLKAREQDG